MAIDKSASAPAEDAIHGADRPCGPEADVPRLIRALEARLQELDPFVLAFSGGLDSRLLVHVALGIGATVQAVHVSGPHIPAEEEAESRTWAATRRLPLAIVELDVLAIPAVAAGQQDRCYHCKRALLEAMGSVTPNLPLCDGTNASDLTKYRPGIRALHELRVISPLAEAGLTKAVIHAIAARTGLDRPDQAARPCLLTRFNYGLKPDKDILARIDAAETAVAAIFARYSGDSANSLPDYRLRVEAPGSYALHFASPGRSVALRRDLESALAVHGFADARLVVTSAVSGYFDRQTKRV